MVTARAHATIEVDGTPVFYETEGDGDPLVLLHGGLADNSTWAAQFAGLAPHCRVVAPERQGHGHTPDRPGPITYEAMAEQTVGLLRALELGPANLVGWSDGGMVGILVAAQHPQLVRTLTVCGTAFSYAGYVPGAMEELVALTSEDDNIALFAALHAVSSPDGPEHFPEVWNKIRTLWSTPFDWTAIIGRITAPTLVMVGDDDYVSVPHAEEFARRVTRGQLAVAPGASHVLPMEKPELFNQLVLDFTSNPVPDTMMPIRRTASH
jgi:pimeloyl-ACP methyl ester carboxylesterase